MLIQLLHGSDKDSGLLGNTRGSKAARERAAAALHNIVHSHPDDKRGRREARVLRFLEQIRAHCDQLREIQEDSPEMSGKKWGSLRETFLGIFFSSFLELYKEGRQKIVEVKQDLDLFHSTVLCVLN